jgi:hypothetical protein
MACQSHFIRSLTTKYILEVSTNVPQHIEFQLVLTGIVALVLGILFGIAVATVYFKKGLSHATIQNKNT